MKIFKELFRNVQPRFIVDRYNGVAVEYTFKNIDFEGIKKKKSGPLFWENIGSKLLGTGSIVCFFVKESHSDDYTFYVGNVIGKRKFIGKNVSVTMKMIESDSLEKLLLLNREISDEEMLLMEVRGHFFITAKAILSCLQNHTTTSIPLVEDLGILPGQRSRRIPAYLRNCSIDFSSVCISPSRKIFISYGDQPSIIYNIF